MSVIHAFVWATILCPLSTKIYCKSLPSNEYSYFAAELHCDLIGTDQMDLPTKDHYSTAKDRPQRFFKVRRESTATYITLRMV